jgi:hypothetical protein
MGKTVFHLDQSNWSGCSQSQFLFLKGKSRQVIDAHRSRLLHPCGE